MKLVPMILSLVAKLQYQVMSWRRNDRNRDGGGVALLSGILSVMNVYLISSAKASSGLALR